MGLCLPEETKAKRWNSTSYKQVRPDLRRTGLEALGPEKSGGGGGEKQHLSVGLLWEVGV